jgi:hypothetical protein
MRLLEHRKHLLKRNFKKGLAHVYCGCNPNKSPQFQVFHPKTKMTPERGHLISSLANYLMSHAIGINHDYLVV